MARRDKTTWRVAIDQSAAGETAIQAAVAGQRHCLLGFFLVPDGAGTFQFHTDDGAVETPLSGVCKMVDGAAVGFRGDDEDPVFVTDAGEALVLETVTATVSGFAYGYTEGE